MKLLQTSACTLALVLGLASTALGQVTINGTTIPDNQVERVTTHCQTLAALDREEAAEPIGTVAQGQGDGETNPGGEGGAPGSYDGQGNVEGITDLTAADDASPAETANPDEIDLDTITLEACQESGLVPVASN